MLWLAAPAARIMPELTVKVPVGLAVRVMAVAASNTRELIVLTVASEVIAVDTV